MSERGFIAVDRGVFDHAIFTDEPKTEREAWLWIIANAVWAPQQKRVGSQVLDLKRGQLGCSLRFLAKAWMWNDSRVRRFLAKLQAAQMIDAVSTQMATQITVCNYDVYQQSRRGSDADSGAVATQTNTRKPDTKSEPNGSSRSAQRGSRILSFEPDVSVAVEMGLTPEQARFQAEFFKDFWRGKAGQAGVKLDWPATWRNWVRDKLPAANRGGLRLAHANRDPPKKSGAALMEESSRELLDEIRNPDTQRWELERVYDGYAHRR